MKNLLLDICLVFLVIYVGDALLNHHYVSQVMFQQSIDQFEEDIHQQKTLQDHYVVTKETKENSVAKFMGQLSKGCIDIIRYIVLFISDMISMLAMQIIFIK